MKKLAILFLTLSINAQAYAQKALIKRLLSNEKDTTRGPSFLPVPVIGYSQEIGLELGLGALYSYYIDRKDTVNRSSNFSGTATYSTKKSYNLTLRADIWGRENNYHFIGEVKFKKMPFNFYGIGNQTLAANEDKLIRQQFKILLEAEKQLAPNLYSGISAGFEHYRFTDKIPGGIFTDESFTGRHGGKIWFFGLSQSFDTRNSNNYPTKGFFGRLTYQYAPGIYSAENFTGSQVQLNLRNFFQLNSKLVLGLQGLLQTINGKNLPFYLLPQLGNDEIMRGYYTGRYRDKSLAAVQTELRYRYNNRFGAVLFAGTGTVFGEKGFTTHALKPSYGGGLRYFFDPAKGLSIRLDYGIGDKRKNEKRQTGFYLSLAEAF